MSYFNNPKVDKAAERSEESVNETRSLFTKKNGFIIREENPDYGVDFDAELIENSGATRKKFAIQIKSSKSFKVNTVNNQQFLIIDFLTSRLGYIAKNTPGLGLIVLYDEGKRKIYYDFIEEIIERINSHKKDASWLYQEKVRIHIPEQNELDCTKIHEIYKKFLNAHNNHNLLLHNYAKDFNVPFVEISEAGAVRTEEKLMTLLNKYGFFLINNFMFSELYNGISQLSYQKISQNSKLSFIAAIVYAEIGKPIDSNMFIQYYEMNNTETTNLYTDIIKFTKYKNKFLLGNRDFKKLINDLEELVSRSKTEHNTLILKINISLIKTMASYDNMETDKALLKEMAELHNEIENSKLDDNIKHLLNIYQSESYHAYALKVFSESITQQRLKEKLGAIISQSERVANAQELNEMLSIPIKYTQKALEYAESNNDKLVKAHALHKTALFFFKTQFNILAFDVNLDEKSIINILKNCYNLSIESFNLFLDLSQLNEAHLTLCVAYEIDRLLHYKYQTKIHTNEHDSLMVTIRELEREIGKKAFISIVEMYFNDKKLHEKTNLQKITDEEIQFFPKSILKAKNLPANRLDNLVEDIKNRQYFERYCDTQKYELLQDNVSGDGTYSHPTNYIIINKISNLLIGRGRNLQMMVSDLGLVQDKKNEA